MSQRKKLNNPVDIVNKMTSTYTEIFDILKEIKAEVDADE